MRGNVLPDLRQYLSAWEPELGPAGIRAGAEDLADSAAVTWRLTNRPTDPDTTRQLAAAYTQGLPCPELSPATVQPGTPAGAAKPSPLANLLRQALTDPDRDTPTSHSSPETADSDAALDSGLDAEIAYIRGDYRTAAAIYLARIAHSLSKRAAPESVHIADRASPMNTSTTLQADDDTSAWAGLALSLRRLSRGTKSAATETAATETAGTETAGTDTAGTAAAALLGRPELVRAVVRDLGADPLAVAQWLETSLAPGQSICRQTAAPPVTAMVGRSRS